MQEARHRPHWNTEKALTDEGVQYSGFGVSLLANCYWLLVIGYSGRGRIPWAPPAEHTEYGIPITACELHCVPSALCSPPSAPRPFLPNRSDSALLCLTSTAAASSLILCSLPSAPCSLLLVPCPFEQQLTRSSNNQYSIRNNQQSMGSNLQLPNDE